MDRTVFFAKILLTVHIWSASRATGCTNPTEFCERIQFDLFKDTLKNKALKGHTFLTLAVPGASECQMKCISDCRCLSTNYIPSSDNGYGQCELNNANHILRPKQLVSTPGTFYSTLKRKFVCKKGDVVFDVKKHSCPKSCCLSSPCPAHTTCREICLPNFTRFMCVCRPGNTQNCLRLPRTCRDITKLLGFSPADGLYHVYDSQGNLYQVYCDFTSEPNYAFTLVESFAFANRDIFKSLGFYTDAPKQQDLFNWENYRLAKERMQVIANHSTHLRSTCNRPVAFSYTDYLRIKLQELEIFKAFAAKCPRYERMNFAGHECFNCTVGTWQVANEHFHISGYYSVSPTGCEFGYTGFNQALFGYYPVAANPGNFGCCRSDQSTTQFWMGSSLYN